MIDASNQSGGMAIFIGGNGVWGKGGGAGSNDDLIGPGTIDENSNANNPLPIELVFFSGKANHRTVLLEWATSSEENFDFFTIQRSKDAFEWEEIATIPGSGNSGFLINYSCEDPQPLPGISFYRLKAVDFDGVFEIFHAISVEFEPDEVYRFYPNPLSLNSLLIVNNYNQEEESVIVIYNATGQIFFKRNLQLGVNHLQFKESPDPGVYILRILASGASFTKRILITGR